MSLKTPFFPFLVIVSFLFGCDSTPDTLFVKMAPEETGIHFVNTNQENVAMNILVYEYFYNGGGVAAGDINNDGLTDLYFTSNDEKNKLYLNKGNWRFEDITQSSGTACEPGWKTGVSMVDINADGFLDIYVCRSAYQDPEQRRNLLLINNGDMTFTDRAAEYGLDDQSFSTQAAFFDFDKDGDLDMFLLNHSLLSISNSFDLSMRNNTKRYPDVGNKFFINNDGKFTDVSDSVGVFGPASNYGLGIALSDFNNDGWTDVYTTCDYTGPDHLLLNQEGRYFIDAIDTALTHISKFTMGLDVADINNDGNIDLYTLDMLPEDNLRQKQLLSSDNYDAYRRAVEVGLHHQYMRNMLHLNNGTGNFSEIGQLAGVSNTDWSWAALLADYDNDGNNDLFVTNGFKRDLNNKDYIKYRNANKVGGIDQREKMAELINKMPVSDLHNYIYKGSEKIVFEEKTEDWGFEHATLSNGAVYADLDNDGDLDLTTNDINEPAGVYRNQTIETTETGNYLKVKLAGTGKNTFGIGARVFLYKNGNTQLKEQYPVRGFQSSVDPVLFFGSGKVASYDSLRVVWPTGEQQVLMAVKTNQILTLHQKDAQQQSSSAKSKAVGIYLTEAEAGLDFKHDENLFIDFKTQALLPRMYSREGPAMAMGDVNADDLQDIYIGGAKGQSGALFIQQTNGTYQLADQSAFRIHQHAEDVNATFFDADGDDDLDLYVASGGYEFSKEAPELQDRLYLNDGSGNFILSTLPDFRSSTSAIATGDVDQDGDIDLFVGGRLIPGEYPKSPDSYLLLNDGDGRFDLIKDELLSKLGMVTDATLEDLDSDGSSELLVAGEWMPLRVFKYDDGKLRDISVQFFENELPGWWHSLTLADFDHDGDKDLIGGNVGLNSQLQPDAEHPIEVFFDDFDQNGAVDPIITYYIGETSYPYPNRDELLEQLPILKKKFNDYETYAKATINEVLTEYQIKNAKKLKATHFATTYFENVEGKFTARSLPIEMQFAPIYDIAVADINHDGNLDLLTGGNLQQARARTGKMTGNAAFVFLGDGKGRFEFIDPATAGVHLLDDIRQIRVERNRIIYALNDGPVRVYQVISGGKNKAIADAK